MAAVSWPVGGHRPGRRASVRLMAGGVLSALLCLAAIAPAGAASPALISLPNDMPDLTGARILGAAPASQILQVELTLPLRDPAGVAALLAAQSDPASPLYRRYLTSAEFTAHYAPTAARYAAAADFLRHAGLRVDDLLPNRLLVGVEGTVAQLERAFHVRIAAVRLADGRAAVANLDAPRLPAGLAGVVDGVVGLDTVGQFQPRFTAGARPAANGPIGYAPSDMWSAYNFQPLLQAGDNGAGKTIAILTAFSYGAGDVRQFESTFKLARHTLQNVPVGGSSSKTNLETLLDIEWSGGMAPGATIRVYEAHSATNATFLSMYQHFAADNAAQVMSTSWGECEFQARNIAQGTATAMAMAASEGISLFAASGDSGSSCGNRTAVDFPANDVSITGVGGTTMIISNGHIAYEAGWNGSGGGFSATLARPAWQTGKGLPSNGKRGVPDVAYAADPLAGFAVYYQGSWTMVGGTSDAAPQWAGLLADIDQYLGAKGNVGFANPALYRVAGASAATAYHDITSGSNGTYNCNPGWDAVTGWGSPNGYGLAQALAR